MQSWLRNFIYLSVLYISACPGPLHYDNPPKNQFYYPQSMVQSADGSRLLVVSSNRNQRYGGGSIISIDLTKVDAQLINPVIKTPDVSDDSVFTPSFSLSPRVSGNQIFLLSQEKHQLVNLAWDGHQLGAHVATTQLPWRNPYYLDSDKNLIGYVHPAVRERVSLTSPQSKFGELQTFTPPPNFQINDTIHIEKWLNDDVKPSTDKNTYPPDANKEEVKRFSHIGAMQIINDHLLLAVDAPLSYTNLAYSQIASHLLWIPTADLTGNTKPEQIALSPLTNGATQVADFALTSDNKKIFIIMSAPATLVRVDLDLTQNQLNFRDAVSICDRPTAITLSPNDKTVLIACDSGSQIEAYETQNLALVGSQKPVGALSPTQILLDNRGNNRFYVSYSESGTIGVFQFNGTSLNQIEFLCQIGQTAALNHLGGFQP